MVVEWAGLVDENALGAAIVRVLTYGLACEVDTWDEGECSESCSEFNQSKILEMDNLQDLVLMNGPHQIIFELKYWKRFFLTTRSLRDDCFNVLTMK